MNLSTIPALIGSGDQLDFCTDLLGQPCVQVRGPDLREVHAHRPAMNTGA